jgi:hypothetical protein
MNKEKTITVQARVTETMHEIIQKISELKQVTMAEYFRGAIQRSLESEKEIYKDLLEKKMRTRKKK